MTTLFIQLQSYGLDRGPLSPHIKPYISLLEEQGYRLDTLRVHLRVFRKLNRWLLRTGRCLSVLDEAAIGQFSKAHLRRPQGWTGERRRCVGFWACSGRRRSRLRPRQCCLRPRSCERLLVQEAFRVFRAGKMLVPIIDDAHLMPSDSLRKLRLLFEDFPPSHNLVLIGQPPLLQSLSLSINEEIRSRVTYSVVLPRLGPEAIEAFILAQLDRAGLGHNTFSPEALALIVRSGDGLLRRTRNLCLGSLLEAVRDQARTVDLKQVNRVLIQPHWRKENDTPLFG